MRIWSSVPCNEVIKVLNYQKEKDYLDQIFYLYWQPRMLLTGRYALATIFSSCHELSEIITTRCRLCKHSGGVFICVISRSENMPDCTNQPTGTGCFRNHFCRITTIFLMRRNCCRWSYYRADSVETAFDYIPENNRHQQLPTASRCNAPRTLVSATLFIVNPMLPTERNAKEYHLETGVVSGIDIYDSPAGCCFY